MKFIATLSVLFLLVASSLAITVSYDPKYDNGGGKLDTVACSDSENGLITKGFSTFGSLPRFPRIGGAQAVAAWNSGNCGTCWTLTYKGRSIHVLAVDHANSGFNIAQRAMDELTGGQAVQLGRINATATQDPNGSACGL